MPYYEKAVRHERQYPVAPRRAHGQQFHRRDVWAEAGLQALEPLDVTNVTRALGALEDDRRVVLAIQLGAETPVQHRLGPSSKEIDVGRVVHGVDRACPWRSGGDFAEYGFTLCRTVPLHVREPCLKAEGLEDGETHLAPAREMIGLDVAQHHRLRANPLLLPCGQRAGPVHTDIPEGDFAVDAHRVEGVFLSVDEFFDIDLANVAGA